MKPTKRLEESVANDSIAASDTSSNDPLNIPGPTETPHRTLRILLVDDSDDDQHIIKQLLHSSSKRLAVHTVSDLASALEQLSLRETDLVLLDYMLSDGIEGPVHIPEMRDIAADPHLPIIVLTGFGDERKATEAFKDGADDYYPKRDMNSDNLLAAISAAFEHSILARKSSQYRTQVMRSNSELKHKNQQIGSFYQTVAHELKNPLTGVFQHTSLILDGILGEITPSQKRSLETIISCCASLNRIMNDLIDTAEIEKGTLKLALENCQLNELAKSCMANNEFAAANKRINLIFNSCDNLPELNCDRVRIEQVINNLLNNALKYTDEDGTIELKLSIDEPQRAISISVKDNGAGMAEEELKSIFDKFYQAKSGSEMVSHKGSLGLGLFICHKIVQLHQGELLVRSKLGAGSEFQAVLPLVREDTSP